MNYWTTTVDETNYTVTLDGNLIRFTKDCGSPESFGGNDVPIARFLRSEKLHQHMKDVFGEAALSEVLSAAVESAGAPNA